MHYLEDNKYLNKTIECLKKFTLLLVQNYSNLYYRRLLQNNPHTHVCVMDSGTGCTLSRFADGTMLSGVPAGCREGIPSGPAARRTRAMELNRAKSKVLHVGQGNPKHKHKLGREWT